jgi:hypothetical protein
MPTSTWELHYQAPRYPADQQFMVGYLEVLKTSYTTLAIDFDQDEDGIHVMVGDIRTLKDVLVGLSSHGPHKVTVTLEGDDPRAPQVHLKAVAVLLETPNGDDDAILTVGT